MVWSKYILVCWRENSMGVKGEQGDVRETQLRVSTRSPRKSLGKILGCCPNHVVLDGPPKGQRTLRVERGKARRVQDPTREIFYTGTIGEIFEHAMSLTAPTTSSSSIT